jgi:hypothetical protein
MPWRASVWGFRTERAFRACFLLQFLRVHPCCVRTCERANRHAGKKKLHGVLLFLSRSFREPGRPRRPADSPMPFIDTALRCVHVRVFARVVNFPAIEFDGAARRDA